MDDSTKIWVEGAWPRVLQIIMNWWEKLQEPANRGVRAELRRARSADDVALQGPYYALLAKIVAIEDLGMLKNSIPYRLPSVIGVLAHVKANNPDVKVAQAMGAKKKGSDQARVSDLRFRRILRLEEGDELYTTMIRVVRMLDDTVNVADLASSIFFWNEKTRKRWASQYYLQRNIFED
ncbi:MAG TPA: type I-E CRISPR-associated protein Cse2/CasB [Sphaerochaeta sp.]|nr:type I-E CRISPR-associated protein Cse2/CasB [Sphaerochaeta sp.]HPK47354.1 type I-E CRISPR-associated protein Cse2/CasB [Sphaerochaeta sp.]